MAGLLMEITMRSIILAIALTASAPAMAQTAATAPASPSAPAAPATHYTTAETDVGTLIDNPASKAIVDKYIPGFSGNDQVAMARGMTLKQIQQYAPDKFTDKVLSDIDHDLAAIPAAK